MKKIGLRKRAALELFARLYQDKVRQHPLRTLFWECTLRCNLNCRHCGSDCRTEAAARDMPAADFLRTIDSITPHVDPHKVMIVFTGGEALMRRDLETVGRELNRREYPWGLVTNGMLLDQTRMQLLLAAGMHSLTLSLDGFAEQHNYLRGNASSYERALRALRLMVKAPLPACDVVTCVSSDVLPILPDLRDMLIAEGLKSWRLFTIFPAGRAADDPRLQLDNGGFRQLMEFIRQTREQGKIQASYGCEGFLGGYEAEVRDRFYHCSAGVSTAGIRIDGSISGCTSIRADYDQGNIYRDDFMDVWNNRYEAYRNREWMRRDLCGSCKYFRYCLGGGMHLRDDLGRLMLCHYEKLK